jgi:hypothetical protein
MSPFINGRRNPKFNHPNYQSHFTIGNRDLKDKEKDTSLLNITTIQNILDETATKHEISMKLDNYNNYNTHNDASESMFLDDPDPRAFHVNI